MLETAVALIFAHLVADFVLQSDTMVRQKQRLLVTLLHVGIVLLLSWAALGLAPLPLLLAVVGATHAIIDQLKLTWTRRCRAQGREAGFTAFATDQTGHFAVIVLAAGLWPGAWSAGLWDEPALLAHLPVLTRLPEAMALASGVIATVWAGGYAVRELMAGLKLPLDPASDASLPLGGQLIGRLERLMILMLLLADQPDGIGLLIAAKSILRFNELARDASDRRASEYVIIGTLASFAWAIGTAWATTAVLDALAP
jgi:Protein of unknown function (DUF3307)